MSSLPDAEDFAALVTNGDEPAAVAALQRNPALASVRNAEGVSVVCLAVYRRRPQLAAALAALRADLDIFEAVCLGDTERAGQLAAADPACVNAVSPDGFSPVGYAAFFGHAALLRELIRRGGEVNAPARNAMRVCALHSAAAHSDQARAVELARIVLEAGGDPNARQHGGFTPLHEAAGNGNLPLIELLLQRGADPALTNDKGERAIDVASTRGHDAAVARLRAALPA